MLPDSLDNKIREWSDGGGVYYWKPFHTFLRPAAAAVRGEGFPVDAEQIRVYTLKDYLRPAFAGICKRASYRPHCYSQMTQFASLSQLECGNLPLRVETHEHSVEHQPQMGPSIKPLHIPLSVLSLPT